MSYSSGLPTGRGISHITQIIRQRTSATTVTRATKTRNDLDGTDETTSEHTEDMWLFAPNESTPTEITGYEVNGSLGGLLVADGGEDLAIEDRIVHGGVEYEVDSVVGHPNDESPDGSSDYPDVDFWVIDFTRRNT